MAKVSVVIPSYNCARYLMQSVNSVLSQTITDLEVIVVDDGSTDESVSIIGEIKDPRVKAIILPANTGGAAALNTGLKSATSELFALCNCDDEWLPDKLEKQIQILESQSVGAVFTNVSWINEQGDIRPDGEVPHPDLFTVDNRSQFEWLKRLADGNCLCHPSILIKRKIYDELGLYDNRLRQLPDYDMWLRLTQKHQIFVMPEKLMRFRILDSEGNTSSLKPDNVVREANECALVLENFYRNLSEENFVCTFGSRKKRGEQGFNLTLEKAFYLATAPCRLPLMLRHLALRLLYEFWATPESEAAIAAYGEDYQFIYALSGISSPFRDVRPVTKMSAKEWQKMMKWAGLSESEACGAPSEEFVARYKDEGTQQIEYFSARSEKLQGKLDATRDELARRENRIAELKTHIIELEKVIAHSSNERESLNQALSTSSENSLILQKEIVELKATLEEMGNSRSWKLTAPIRGFRSRLRKPK